MWAQILESECVANKEGGCLGPVTGSLDLKSIYCALPMSLYILREVLYSSNCGLSHWLMTGVICSFFHACAILAQGAQKGFTGLFISLQVSPPPTLFMGELNKFPWPRGSALCSHCLVVYIHYWSGMHSPNDWDVLLGWGTEGRVTNLWLVHNTASRSCVPAQIKNLWVLFVGQDCLLWLHACEDQ